MDAFENQHRSIFVIPEAIVKARAFKFGSVGALDILINISGGNHKILPIILLIFSLCSLRRHCLCDKSKNVSSIDLIFVMHNLWGKTLDAFKHQHCSSLYMCIFSQLLIFALWSFLRPVFKLEQSNLGQLEDLTHLLTSVPCFVIIQKLYFC